MNKGNDGWGGETRGEYSDQNVITWENVPMQSGGGDGRYIITHETVRAPELSAPEVADSMVSTVYITRTRKDSEFAVEVPSGESEVSEASRMYSSQPAILLQTESGAMATAAENWKAKSVTQDAQGIFLFKIYSYLRLRH